MKRKFKVDFDSKETELKYISDFKSGVISKEDNRVIRRWVLKVENEGPESLLSEKKWDDHPLDGNWRGYRSSSFSGSGRIIYKVEDDILKVFVVRITADHNYKK